MDPLSDLDLLSEPWVTAAGLGLLLLIWWALRRRRSQTLQTQQPDADRFSQRRTRTNEGAPLPPPGEGTSAQRVAPVQDAPQPAHGPKRDVDTVSGSRWMQSRIPAGEASEVSDSELAIWGPTAIMSALDEAAAAPGPSDTAARSGSGD